MAAGTTKKSAETRSLTWFAKNVRQVCEGGLLCRTNYLATVVSETLMPSLPSSP